MIRVAFIDLDGTLVGASNTVSSRARQAIQRAREAGCEVVLCTGRSRISTLPIADQLGFRGYAVTNNGAVAMHLDTGEVLYRNLLPIPSALAAVRALLAAGLVPQVYEDAITSARILYHPEHPVPEMIGRHTPWATLTTSLPFTPACVSAFGPEAVVRPVAERLAEEPPEGACVLQAGTHNAWCLEVHHRESGKQNAARRILDYLGLGRADALAIGDHLNDVALLEFASVGIAMGNALPVVRARAGHVTATLEEEGVAIAIERWVLGEASGQ